MLQWRSVWDKGLSSLLKICAYSNDAVSYSSSSGIVVHAEIM
jgi:hypothetical protein